MTPAQWRRVNSAARQMDPARAAAYYARIDRAEAILRAALTDGPLALPGYRVTLADGRPIVARSDITNAAQLALWRTLQETNA